MAKTDRQPTAHRPEPHGTRPVRVYGGRIDSIAREERPGRRRSGLTGRHGEGRGEPRLPVTESRREELQPS